MLDVKNFNILAISIYIYNFDPTKLFLNLYPDKYLNILASIHSVHSYYRIRVGIFSSIERVDFLENIQCLVVPTFQNKKPRTLWKSEKSDARKKLR